MVRARPQSAEPSAPRVLEVGDVNDEGSFVGRDTITVAGTPSYVAIAADGRGGLWLTWVDASGSWLERLACK